MLALRAGTQSCSHRTGPNLRLLSALALSPKPVYTCSFPRPLDWAFDLWPWADLRYRELSSGATAYSVVKPLQFLALLLKKQYFR